MSRANRDAFENVKDQIGFCGIWCGSCVVGNGTLQELTSRYEEMVAAYGLKEWAPPEFDHAAFSKALSVLEGIPPCPGCLKGGGREKCEMRACAAGRGLRGCAECDVGSDCGHAEVLERMRSGARAAGLLVEAGRGDPGEMIARWTAELPSRWPSCVLFVDDRSEGGR